MAVISCRHPTVLRQPKQQAARSTLAFGCRRSRRRAIRAQAKMDPQQLRSVAEAAAKAGAQVVMAAVDRPRSISYKRTADDEGGPDLVTDTDKASEAAVVAAIRDAVPDHAILGEEGGVMGDVNSEYLWCIDPIDGTTNFAHSYPGFCVSVGVIRHSLPVAGCVIEFTGGPGGWGTRTYSAARNCGATCDGQPISVSAVRDLDKALLLTEHVYYEELWDANLDMLRTCTQKSRGIRCSGAAAVNLCKVALGVADGYVQFMLKPWDVAAGVLILEEAGGRISTAAGLPYSVWDRSLLASNDGVHSSLLSVVGPHMQRLVADGVQLGPANVPAGYRVKAGAQLA